MEEIERKYDVPRRWVAPRLVGVGRIATVAAPRRFTQTATYLDTPDLALLRAKRTLRRRVGGVDAGWHLKLPADAAAFAAPVHAAPAVVAPETAVPEVAVSEVAVVEAAVAEAAVPDGAFAPSIVGTPGGAGTPAGAGPATTAAPEPAAGPPPQARLEVHEPLGASAARVPAALRARVADIIGPAPLIPVAILRTRRVERRLLDDAGRLVAELVDDTVEATVLLDGERILRWREVELELGPGGEVADLDAVSAALARSHLVPASGPSKLGRALAEPLAALTAARGGGKGAPDPTAGAVVTAYLADQLGVLQALESAVREDAPDAVHRMRVATRRARSVLKTYRDLYDRSVTDDLRAELAWLAALLGGPRDAEVLHERLTALLADVEPDLLVGPVRERVLGMLEDDHAAGRKALVAALDGRRYERLLADLTEAVLRPPYVGTLASAPASKVVPAYAGRAAQAVVKAAKKADAASPTERDILIHEVRKVAKAARYAAEAATPVVGKSGAGTPGWTRLQQALGDYQDGVVAREALHRALTAARAAGEDAFSYGVLIEREAAAGRAIEASYGALLAGALKGAKGVRAKR